MSVTITSTFSSTTELNLSNSNFYDLWNALGLSPEGEHGTVGDISAHELAVKCRRYNMKQSVKGPDAALAQTKSGNVINCARPAGYLSGRVSEVLALAELDSTATIRWA